MSATIARTMQPTAPTIVTTTTTSGVELARPPMPARAKPFSAPRPWAGAVRPATMQPLTLAPHGLKAHP